MAQSDQEQYARPSQLETGGSQYNALLFLINQVLAGRYTVAVVRVVAVTNAGEVDAAGYVDVQPMLNQLDAAGNSYPHGTVYELPYFRLQGGSNAIIIDPQVDDIGLALVADRDISSLKAAKDLSNPGSMRRADLADGLYIGGFLNGVPEQFVQFSAAGITLTSPTVVTINAPLVVNGTITASDIIAAPDVVGGGKSLATHVHTGVSRGGSNTDGPL